MSPYLVSFPAPSSSLLRVPFPLRPLLHDLLHSGSKNLPIKCIHLDQAIPQPTSRPLITKYTWLQSTFIPLEQRQLVQLILSKILEADVPSIFSPAFWKHLADMSVEPDPMGAVCLGSHDLPLAKVGGCHFVGCASER